MKVLCELCEINPVEVIGYDPESLDMANLCDPCVKLLLAVPVRPCCGCTCHVCAEGHNAEKPEHTVDCSDRFMIEWIRDNDG